MKVREILDKLRELLEPELIDPHYGWDSDMFYRTQLQALIEQIENEN